MDAHWDVERLGDREIRVEAFIARRNTVVLYRHFGEHRVPALREPLPDLVRRRQRRPAESESQPRDRPITAHLPPAFDQWATRHSDDVAPL